MPPARSTSDKFSQIQKNDKAIGGFSCRKIRRSLFAYKGENIPLSPPHGRYSAQPDNLSAIAASIATP